MSHLAIDGASGSIPRSLPEIRTASKGKIRREDVMAHAVIDGVWHTRFHDTKATGGKFKRTEPKFRNWVTPDGSAGPSGSGGFAAARGRYHLYVSLACPWAHRTVVYRKIKGLEDVISMSVVEPVMGDQGWQFGPDADP
jgi:putative glutathione S-transferase